MRPPCAGNTNVQTSNPSELHAGYNLKYHPVDVKKTLFKDRMQDGRNAPTNIRSQP